MEFIRTNSLKIEELGLTYFEISFAMAVDYFATKKVDYTILEVGLGGRLDATNVVDPVISVITNIGYDHKEFLGNSLEEIAIEKAGIIKYKVPVVVGGIIPPVDARKLISIGVKAVFTPKDFKIEEIMSSLVNIIRGPNE